MTREEAIHHLEEMKKGIFLWDMSELIDLCISALSVPEGEYINKSVVLTEMDKRHADGDFITKGFINSLPTFSVPEREKGTDIEGEWRTNKQGFTYCTLCKFTKIQNDGRSYKFCPWCGKPMITAYMRGGKE